MRAAGAKLLSGWGNVKTDLASLFISGAFEDAPAGGRSGDLVATFEDKEAWGEQAKGLKGVGRVQKKEIRWLALLDAIAVLNAQGSGRVRCDEIQHVFDLLITAHMAEEERELSGGQHIAASQGKPGVHNGVVSQRDIDASGQQFFYAGDAPAFGIGIEAPLKHHVIKGIGDDIHPGARQQTQ